MAWTTLERPVVLPASSLLLLVVVALPAQAWQGEETNVATAIEAGKRALLERISEYDQIEYQTPQGNQGLERVRGTVTRRLGPVIVVRVLGGGTIKIPRRSIVLWATPGHIYPEMSGFYYGGPSALVAFALVCAGVDTTHPAMAMLLDALAKDDANEAGTYVHGLRASVWGALLERPIRSSHRAKYRKLLREDMTWLMKAMHVDGGYSYTAAPGGGWDHSNTQFANLGLWAGAAGGIEVADRIWLRMARHWMEAQVPSGGWGYSSSGETASSSMTVAGCNSLYIALDRYYSRADGPYRYFKGAKPNTKARKEMQGIYEAIHMGDQFLELKPPNVAQFHGYELFGLERLGVASGQAVIGGLDWFRHYVHGVANHRWGQDEIADAFALIFLVYGQAPVLVQKLEHGDSADDWNYYHRDLPSLVRYMSRTFERLYRWQRIQNDASLWEMQDAPILYISGRKELDLPDETLKRIRQYVERGGTVFLHADRASKEFVKSAATVFERMFRDRDYHFESLDEAHPLFNCHFDCRSREPKRQIPLQVIADGPRLPVLLCPVDIAGAWHQERLAKCEALFQMMANVRVYTAPPYNELPTRLRPAPLAGPSAPQRGSLRLLRLPHAGHWNAHPGAWRHFANGLRHRTGIDLAIEAGASAPGPGALDGFDVVHLTTRRPLRLNDATLATLRAYLEGGGLLLIDAADGQPAGIAAISKLVDTIDVGTRGILSADHHIATGAMPGGRPLTDLETTKAGSSLVAGHAPPPILTRVIDGRVAVIACPFDLLAGLDEHFVWNRSGYTPASTARIVDNILLWRLR
ncbi:MAG: DUF4159 domain-containing protein [Phycisphaerae bacterium]|nr:DUF4159 domain-containing protein [Phycisphaerae bacterium]